MKPKCKIQGIKLPREGNTSSNPRRQRLVGMDMLSKPSFTNETNDLIINLLTDSVPIFQL